jgi:hypothetical protein
MPSLDYDLRSFLDAFDARTKTRDFRRKTETISELKARTNQDPYLLFHRDERRTN